MPSQSSFLLVATQQPSSTMPSQSLSTPSQTSDIGSQPGGGHSATGILQPGFDWPHTQVTSGGGQPSSATPSQLLSMPSQTSGPQVQPLSMTPSQSSSLPLPHTSLLGLQQPSSI